MKYVYRLTIESDKPLYILDILEDIGMNICDGKDYKFYVGSDVQFDDDVIPF